MKRIITLDFETEKIEGRPAYPPRPVGLSVKTDDYDSHYYAWGHPEGNNETLVGVKELLRVIWGAVLCGQAELLFHNAKFDLAVCYEIFELPELPWHAVHDTMFLAFLADPHSRAIDLKGLASSLLDWPAEERDAVAEWLWENRKQLLDEHGVKIAKEQGSNPPRANKKSTGENLSLVPADIVAPYAEGDTDRTFALFREIMPTIEAAGMLEAYNRERQVLPIFMENERLGIRVDVEALARDVEAYEGHMKTVDAWLQKRLGDTQLNLDADNDVAAALDAAGVVDPDAWTYTKTGKRSVSKTNLTPDKYNDPQVANAFGYRNRLATCLKMFMKPWLAQALVNDGCISTNWNQTRGGDGGTRTGRPSTNNSNLLNISKSFEGRTDGYEHPDHLDVPPLPLVREYVLADDGHVFLHRDFDGQELRIFGHYESGELLSAYRKDPSLDVHALVGEKMAALAGKEFERTRVKVVNFQSIYGGGVTALVRELRISNAEAKGFKEFHNQALPGRVILNEEIKRMIRGGEPIRTWGGRCYFAEEPRKINGRMMDFLYKLLNYLVQGSAADITKEALIRWWYHPKRKKHWRFLVTVYDEINISAPLHELLEAMALLRSCMESIELDVPMLSSPKVGVSWGKCKKPEKGESEEAFLSRMVEELAA